MDNTTISLTELIGNAKRELGLFDYAKSTQQHYALIWNHFEVYAGQKGQTCFSKELGNEFLNDSYRIKEGIKLSSSQVFKIRAITILEEIRELNCFRRCHQKAGKHIPSQFDNIMKKYDKLQQENNLSKRTICGKKIILVRFLRYLDNQGLSDITSLTSHEVLSYLPTLENYGSNSRSGIMFTLRKFLSFLYSEGYSKEPLHDLFPVIFSHKFERLPSYYSPGEVQRILCQIDRNTEFGRRDYLVLLLAVQLGMRAGDIRQLKLNNIKLSKNTIELVQQKTNNPLQLPATKEFKYALADYMKNSRPKVDDPHIFVRHRAPFQPFVETNTFYHITNKYMLLAGIKLRGRKHGLHSMRHSTARGAFTRWGT